MGQPSLILAGLAVYWFRFSARVIGSLAGFGAGALIAAVAFRLVPESSDLSNPETSLWLLIGAAVFLVSDRVVESLFGGG